MATAGFFSARGKFCGRTRTQRLPNLSDGKGRVRCPKRSQDLGSDAADAGAGQADGTGRSGRKIQNPATDERAAVVDGDDNALAAMGNPELGAEREAAVSRGHGVLIEALARGSLAAGFIAVKRGDTRKAASGARRRGDRGIGVAPGGVGGRIAGVVGMMVMAVVVMPGFGGGFGNAPTDQESCGEKCERRTRLGYFSQRRVLGYQHMLVPRDSIATYVASGTPVPS